MNTVMEAGRFEAASNDGSIEIKAGKIPGDETHVFDAEQSAPDHMGWHDISSTLKLEAEEKGPDEAEYMDRHLGFGIPLDTKITPRIEDVQNHAGLVAGLGYGVERQVSSRGGIRHIHQAQSYPSVDRLNAFMEAVFPGEDEIRFKEHDGGEFSAEEFIRTFVEEGRVLMASEEPFAHHDITDHGLGWIGMDPELSSVLRERLATYLARSKAELELPRVPISDETSDKAKAFLNPSAVVIEQAARGLDNFTDQLPETVLFSKRGGRFDRSVRDIGATVNGLFSTVEFKFGQSGMEALGDRLDESFDKYPKKIIARYEKAEKFYA